MIKKLISLFLAILTAGTLLSGCGKKESPDEGGVSILEFSGAESVEDMSALDGKQVSIIGYMSTVVPASGRFIYLMNMPYQGTPYCVPNHITLTNTVAVYAAEGSKFEFTDLAVAVTGTLEFGSFTDEFGYEYNYRIKDASYSVPDAEQLDTRLALWQQLASAGIIEEVYRMYEYVDFLCSWPTYTAKFEKGTDYIYPSDVVSFCQAESAQYNYGYEEGYFDSIIAEIEGVSKTDLTALIANIRAAESLAAEAIAELEAGNYTAVQEYTGTFGDGRTQYKLNRAEELEASLQKIYAEFAAFLATWEI